MKMRDVNVLLKKIITSTKSSL